MLQVDRSGNDQSSQLGPINEPGKTGDQFMQSVPIKIKRTMCYARS
jgi:hypothetical protein